MAEPSKTRNFFGRVVDRILPGTNYNSQTGQYSNVGAGLGGLAARLITTAYAGPAAGALVNKAAGYLIDRNGNAVGPVQRESVGSVGGVDTSGYQGSVSVPTAANLGFGVQSPGGDWRGYLQGAGSVNNFGNQSFASGSAGGWSPYSSWGSSIANPDTNAGSLNNFGNSVSNFRGGGSGYTSSTASRPSMGLIRAGGPGGGWITALNGGEILGKFQGDPEKYTRAT